MSSKSILANDLIPGSVMHPGQLLKDELETREMKQIDLAKELGIAKNVMSEIINGKRNITPVLAVRLEEALGIKAEFWMKYQMAYEIDKIRIKNKKAIEKAKISDKSKRKLASV
ncbi:MAG: HigA family addiction module antitoxin [Cyclobacteriaceae bacterium]